MKATFQAVGAFATFLCATTSSFSARAQDVCEAFAKYGVYDTRSSASDSDRAASFRSWFCQSSFQNKQDADAAGLSLGYGGFNLGFDSSKENWSQFSSNYCRDDTYNARYRQSTAAFVHTINANASNNMLACFRRGGLHARTIQGARADTFYVEARMDPTGESTTATVTDFYVEGGNCKGPLKPGFVITSAGAEMICRRSGNQAVDLTLSANERVNWDTPRGLSEIVPPEEWPQKQQISIRATDFVRGTNVAIDQCTVGPGILANAPPCNAAPNAAEFDFSVAAPGAYQLEIYFAAANGWPRPIKVYLNGTVIRDQALSETTGGWGNEKLTWSEVGRVTLKEGANIIRLERSDVFPHIHDLKLVPILD